MKPDRVDKFLKMLTDLDAPAIFPDLGAAYFGTFVTKYPENFSPDTQYLSDNTVRFFETALANGDEDPCVNATLDLKSLGMDLLCDELNEVDLRDVVVGADYPIELCHSKTDALVDSENVPDAYLLKYELDGLSHSASVPTCQVKMFEGTELNKKATVLRATKSPKASKASKTPKATKAPKASKSRKGLR